MAKRAFVSTWGMPADEWAACRERMRSLLVGVAAGRSTITYGEISTAVFARRFSARSSALAQMLEEVCTLEDKDNGVSLAAIVVRADTGIPGIGYFAFAHNVLGRALDPLDPADCRRFWEQEVACVWAAFEEHARTGNRTDGQAAAQTDHDG
ncbi:MAG: hypothetical protein LBD25_04710 [Coriobacteriales bacterium]|jgi:hypothetical protein|nr:hypothetical protein [Coriobacteriales bacterium]